jgi:hypothetical protein
MAAAIGGTTSIISGGKFANGAVTGAFNQMYNAETYAAGKWSNILQERLDEEIKRLNNKIDEFLDSVSQTIEERLSASLSVKGAIGPLGAKYQITVNSDTLEGGGLKQYFAQATGLGLSASATADVTLWKSGRVEGIAAKLGGCIGAGLGVCATFVTSEGGNAIVFSPGFVGGISITNAIGPSEVIFRSNHTKSGD